MQRRRRVLGALLILGCLLWMAGAQKAAAETAQTGTLRIQLETKENVGQVEISLYRIGEMEKLPGNWKPALLPDYAESGVTLDYTTASEAEEAARKIDQLIERKAFSPIARSYTDEKGYVQFDGMSIGVYFGRKTGGNGRVDMLPFIVTLPYYQNAGWLYQVSVNPKVEIRPAPTPTQPRPDGGKLPQTGIVRWPAAALSVAGCLFIVLGLLARRKAAGKK